MSKDNATTIFESSNPTNSGKFWQGAIVDARMMIRSINADARARTRELKQSIVLLEELRDSNAHVPEVVDVELEEVA